MEAEYAAKTVVSLNDAVIWLMFTQTKPVVSVVYVEGIVGMNWKRFVSRIPTTQETSIRGREQAVVSQAAI